MSSSAGNGRAMPKGLVPFKPGQSGNPSGRSKEIAAVERLALERSPQAIEALMRISKGRGLAAVRAAETVLAYGLGKPKTELAITARGGPLGGAGGAFAGAARAMLEAAIETAEGAVTNKQPVALGEAGASVRNDSAVIDVASEPAAADRGQAVAESTDEGGSR